MQETRLVFLHGVKRVINMLFILFFSVLWAFKCHFLSTSCVSKFLQKELCRKQRQKALNNSFNVVYSVVCTIVTVIVALYMYQECVCDICIV